MKTAAERKVDFTLECWDRKVERASSDSKNVHKQAKEFARLAKEFPSSVYYEEASIEWKNHADWGLQNIKEMVADAARGYFTSDHFANDRPDTQSALACASKNRIYYELSERNQDRADFARRRRGFGPEERSRLVFETRRRYN
jgi:hypothetical protein